MTVFTTAAEIRDIADPRARVHAVKAAIDAHLEAISELAQITRDQVAEMRAAGLSHAKIAAVLGVTRSRAAQLAAK